MCTGKRYCFAGFAYTVVGGIGVIFVYILYVLPVRPSAGMPGARGRDMMADVREPPRTYICSTQLRILEIYSMFDKEQCHCALFAKSILPLLFSFGVSVVLCRPARQHRPASQVPGQFLSCPVRAALLLICSVISFSVMVLHVTVRSPTGMLPTSLKALS